MAQPLNLRSIDSAEAATVGEQRQVRGHDKISIFVATTDDPSSLQVDLEVSPDGERWAVLDTIDESDLALDDSSGEYTAVVRPPDSFYEFVRLNLQDASGAGAVDAWVLAAGWGASGKRGHPEHRPGYAGPSRAQHAGE